MDKFIYDENLKLLNKRLTETTDEKQRQILRNLIAEQDADYREWVAASTAVEVNPYRSQCLNGGNRDDDRR